MESEGQENNEIDVWSVDGESGCEVEAEGLVPRWEREEDTLAAMIRRLNLQTDFDEIFGENSDRVLLKILSYLDFEDIIHCCQTSETWKAKIKQFHASSPSMRAHFEEKKISHDWLKEDGSMYDVVVPNLRAEKFSVKRLLFDSGTIVLLLESYCDAGSPNFLDDPIEYVVAMWNTKTREGVGQFRVRDVDFLVKDLCCSCRHIFLRYARPRASTVTLVSRRWGRRHLSFSCEEEESGQAFPVDEFHAYGDHLYVWSREGSAKTYLIRDDDSGEIEVEVQGRVETGEDSKCTFQGQRMLTASKHEFCLWDLSLMNLLWRRCVPQLIASIALSEMRVVVEGLDRDFQRTAVLINNTDTGALLKGLALSTNEVLRTKVVGRYLFISFRNGRLLRKLAAFDLGSGNKVLDLAQVGELLDVNVPCNGMAVVSLGSLEAESGTVEVLACRLGPPGKEEEKPRLLLKEHLDDRHSKEYQRVLNRQNAFFATPRGIIREPYGGRLMYYDYVKPIDFSFYLHNHEGCRLHMMPGQECFFNPYETRADSSFDFS